MGSPDQGVRFTPLRGGRGWLSVCMVAFAAVLVAEHVAFGESVVWQWLGVPLRRPLFFDGHNLLAGLDCARQGFDPLRENPCDAFARPMNYPRIWLLLTATPLGRGDEVAFGVTTALAFGLAVLWLAHPTTRLALGVWCAAFISPAVQFGIERGNTELWIFVLVVWALALDRGGRGRGAPVVGVAACLKLYPAAGLFAWLRSRDSRPRLLALLVLLLWCVYLWIIREDVVQIVHSVPRVGSHLFGASVPGWLLERGLAKLGFASSVPWPLWSWLVAAGGCVAAGLWGLRWGPDAAGLPSRSGLTYVLGASLYVGSYLLGASWNYRLVHLLLTLPALLGALGEQRAARFGLALVLAVLWLGGYPRAYLLYVDEWLALALAWWWSAQLGALWPARRLTA